MKKELWEWFRNPSLHSVVPHLSQTLERPHLAVGIARPPQAILHMSYSLNSVKRNYVGDYTGDQGHKRSLRGLYRSSWFWEISGLRAQGAGIWGLRFCEQESDSTSLFRRIPWFLNRASICSRWVPPYEAQLRLIEGIGNGAIRGRWGLI